LLQSATLPFVGNISQRPPIFSAIKKDGKRAYESARAGEVIEMEARPVHISEFALTEVNMPDVQFRVV
jgi:tRNA pseudouridine55 synthase